MRRSALLEVDGFSDGYVYGHEDVDLCLKLRDRGGRLVYDGRAALWHHESSTRNLEEREARVVAGGTDLLLELQQGRRPRVAALVDVTRIPEMSRIETARDDVYIGAAVTHTAIVASALLAKRATCLVESCGVIGGPQVRNVATLGGNVAHALPAGDGRDGS